MTLPQGLARCALSIVMMLAGVSCSPQKGPVEKAYVAPVQLDRSRVLVLGDVDSDTPAMRIRRLEPLATGLASRLEGIDRVDILIARSIDEMCRLLAAGEVDVYLDTPMGASIAISCSSALLVAKRSVRNKLRYHGLIVVRADGAIEELDQLVGRIIAFQEPSSTSGYLLPMSRLLDQGLTMVHVDSPHARPPEEAVGYFFSRDEENTVAHLIDGSVEAGAIADEDWDQLPESYRRQLRVLDRSTEVPRHLFLARGDLPPRLLRSIHEAVLTRPSIDAGGGEWSWDFVAIDASDRKSLEQFQALALSIGGGE